MRGDRSAPGRLLQRIVQGAVHLGDALRQESARLITSSDQEIWFRHGPSRSGPHIDVDSPHGRDRWKRVDGSS